MRNLNFSKAIILTGLFLPSALWAQDLPLNQYLEKVKSLNPTAVSLQKSVESLKNRKQEGSITTTPEFFARYDIGDDRTPPLMPGFQPSRTKMEGYSVGFRGQLPFGMSSSLSFQKNTIGLEGFDPTFVRLNENPYTDSTAKLQFTQSLWRNGFGEKTRADRDAISFSVQAEYENTAFNLKQLLLDAENTYWALSSFNEILELQKENLENARKTNSWMQGRVKQRLYDDVDGLQTQAAFEARQLEYETSLDEQKSLIRLFEKLSNTEFGKQKLEPISNYKTATPKSLSDLKFGGAFEAQRSQQKAKQAQVKAQRSSVRPQLDLIANLMTTGRDDRFTDSLDEMQDGRHPTWMVGVEFATPIDFAFIGRVRKGYDQQIEATAQGLQAVDYDLEKSKADLLAQTQDAANRLKRAQDLEAISQKIAQRERSRHRNGRTTTFQLLKSEQDFASAQIQRVRVQLGYIQLNNALRLFGEEL